MKLKFMFFFLLTFVITQAQAQTNIHVQVNVLDKQTDKPIPNVQVNINFKDGMRSVVTDNKGIADFAGENILPAELIQQSDVITVTAFQDGYSVSTSDFPKELLTPSEVPRLYTVWINKLFAVVDIIVQDSETNKPVSGALVEIQIINSDNQIVRQFNEMTRENGTVRYSSEKLKSDESCYFKVTKDGYSKNSGTLPYLIISPYNQTKSVKFEVELTAVPRSEGSIFIGTWSCKAGIQIIVNADHTGSWVDPRPGQPGTWLGTWQSNGSSLYLTPNDQTKYGGTVPFSLASTGKMYDPWNDEYSK